MNRSSADRRLVWAVWILASLVAAATAAILLGTLRRVDTVEFHDPDTDDWRHEHDVAVSVGSSVLYHDDLALIGTDDPAILRRWIEDQLLADMAVERGLENPRMSRLIQDRARQLHLRDLLLSSIYSGISFPDSAEAMAFMRTDSQAYLVERHYWEMILADRQTADSVHMRLSRGENFQITAENLSLGQKAGIGGDMGYMTAGELMAYGIPREHAVLEGLGSPVESAYGWHIFMVDETRPMEDTARVLRAVTDDLHRMRLDARRDSLLRQALVESEIYLDPVFGEVPTVPLGSGQNVQGVESL